MSKPAGIRTLIVDDEALARQGLRVLLKQEADVEVIGEACDGPSAVSAISTLKPDLVLLDIHLPGFDGLQVLENISATHLPAVVFVTAHDRYAVQAFEAHALDYLLKPVQEARLHATLDRVRRELAKEEALHLRHQRVSDAIQLRAQPASNRLLVKDGQRFVLLNVEEIDWCGAAENYVRVYARSRTFLVRMTMAELEKRLPSDRFVRTHRSAIVNIDRISDMSPASHGDFDVKLKDGTTVRLSRSHKDRLLP